MKSFSKGGEEIRNGLFYVFVDGSAYDWLFSDSPPSVQLPYNLPTAVRSQVEEDWPKILANCPGFKKYAGNMIFDHKRTIGDWIKKAV